MENILFQAIDRRDARRAEEWRKKYEAEASRFDFLLRHLSGGALLDAMGDMQMGDMTDESHSAFVADWRAKIDAVMDRAGVPHERPRMRVGMPHGVEAIHEPTGTMVVCTHERSQHANRDAALRGLRAILSQTKSTHSA
ncbi:peptide chain release factor-like protein [Rhodanobacter sp. 115]